MFERWFGKRITEEKYEESMEQCWRQFSKLKHERDSLSHSVESLVHQVEWMRGNNVDMYDKWDKTKNELGKCKEECERLRLECEDWRRFAVRGGKRPAWLEENG